MFDSGVYARLEFQLIFILNNYPFSKNEKQPYCLAVASRSIGDASYNWGHDIHQGAERFILHRQLLPPAAHGTASLACPDQSDRIESLLTAGLVLAALGPSGTLAVKSHPCSLGFGGRVMARRAGLCCCFSMSIWISCHSSIDQWTFLSRSSIMNKAYHGWKKNCTRFTLVLPLWCSWWEKRYPYSKKLHLIPQM